MVRVYQMLLLLLGVLPVGAVERGETDGASGFETACERWLQTTEMDELFPSAFSLDCLSATWNHATLLSLYRRTGVHEFNWYRCANPVPGKMWRTNCYLPVLELTTRQEATCTGALVAPGIVLTARHCLPVQEVIVHFQRPIPEGTGQPGAGIELEPTPMSYHVMASIAHPEPGKDVALLLLEQAPEVPSLIWRLPGESQPPIPRQDPFPGEAPFNEPGVLVVPGYGAQNREGTAGMGWLSLTAVVTGEEWGCSLDDARQFRCRPRYELIGGPPHLAKRVSRSDPCPGDSGAPLLEYVGQWPVEEGKKGCWDDPACRPNGGWRIVGITSRGLPEQEMACGEGGIYTRMDMVADWMLEGIKKLRAKSKGFSSE